MGQVHKGGEAPPEVSLDPKSIHPIRELLLKEPRLTAQDFSVGEFAIGGKFFGAKKDWEKKWSERILGFFSSPESTQHGAQSVVLPAKCSRRGLDKMQFALKILLDPSNTRLTIEDSGDPSHDIERLPLHENVCSILAHFTAPLSAFAAVDNRLKQFETRELYHNEACLLVLPLLGKDLMKTLKMRKPDHAFITTLCRDLIAGAHHLNKRKFIHRDIKADNILVHRSGGKVRFVIADLGEAWDGNGDLGLSFPWNSDSISVSKAGAPYYHAPEVARVQATGDIMDWSGQDRWSVGWVLYQVLYQAIRGNDERGKPYEPFGGKQGSSVKDDDFIDFDVPDELRHVKFIVRELLRVDPEKRLTFEHALEELEKWAAEESGDMFKAAKAGNLWAMRHFVRGGRINEKNEDGWTPLYIAAENGHKEVAQLLLDNSANVNAPKNTGWTPLYIAAENGHEEVAQLLLDNSANVNAATNTGWTPLYSAAHYGHQEVVQLLLKNHADVNAAWSDCATPLLIAAENGHEEVVQLLLDNSANVNAPKNTGWAPLLIAAQNGHEEVVQRLLEQGANVNAANKNGRTALDIAKTNGHSAVVALLTTPNDAQRREWDWRWWK